jgi:hypothetical protein
MRRNFYLFLIVTSAAVGAAAACSSSSSTPGFTPSDGGQSDGTLPPDDDSGSITVGDSGTPPRDAGPKDVQVKDVVVIPDAATKDVNAKDATPPPDASCLPLETPCDNSPGSCCAGSTCGQVGGLLQKWCCADEDAGCTTNDDCCGQLQCSPTGKCFSTCRALQTPCDTADQCCGNAQCDHVGGLIQTWCCASAGQQCTDPNDCCGQLLCTNGMCN